ncbi:putative Class E vacuolar protein-sorting machinery protein [Zalerion maritima]|uniref:Class E vacuolar protein-sorting machinery protein HSE1 n=1 Tax=Zalerion maritima TaxID=339359 RepID=A0AAD5RXN2_9PEZI|nr:putative Class E vacuolar protein-sorting machinery protein [Zalerion maritima]
MDGDRQTGGLVAQKVHAMEAGLPRMTKPSRQQAQGWPHHSIILPKSLQSKLQAAAFLSRPKPRRFLLLFRLYLRLTSILNSHREYCCSFLTVCPRRRVSCLIRVFAESFRIRPQGRPSETSYCSSVIPLSPPKYPAKITTTTATSQHIHHRLVATPFPTTNTTAVAMFRAAATGPYDETVAKATDENLTAEDWATIIDICDRVGSDSNGPKDVVQSLIRRLAHRNANVQLYTLELANALTQNCGKPMHRELASRSFTDALLKLANDRNTHSQVKSKILERMKEWTEMFKDDGDLGIMREAFARLKQTNPNIQPPSAPQKNNLTDVDRQKEDDELQMALKLSLQEEERRKPQAGPSLSSAAGPAGGSSSSATPGPSGGSATPSAESRTPAPLPSGTTAATVSRVRALFDFVPSEPGELEFKKGDVIAVLESVYKDWWRGSLKGKTGIFPLNYVEKLADPTPDELAREAQMEAEVFAEIKNVEKLLTLLSTNNSAPREEDNEEISACAPHPKLYHQTLAIRPKLIKLIEKYSQKKDDFTQLNEKFIKARRDYEHLLESSMSHPPQHTYHQYGPRPPQAAPGGGYGQPGPSPNYPSQPPSQPQPDQRYYTPGPGQGPQNQPQQYPSSPPPSFQRVGTTPAPFYMAGAEVPPQEQQSPAPQQYPPRDQTPHVAPLNTLGPKQPAPLQTSPPPPVGQYAPYQPPQSQQPSQPDGRPMSTYGNNPQELATSAYDSPIAAPHNPPTGAPYSASVYSQEDPYSAGSGAPAGGAPPQQQPQRQHYTSYQLPPQQAPASTPYDGAGPPSPPPNQGYDGRSNLPSQSGGSHQQYKPYVPPTASTDGPGGPADYYRGYGQ